MSEPTAQAANRAALYATRLDFHLLGAGAADLSPAQRQANLARAFAKFIGLIRHMRELKALEPGLYARCENNALAAREIEGEKA